MSPLMDTVVHIDEVNKIKRDKSHLINHVVKMLRTELPENCTYAELITKARKIGVTYRMSFKMSRYEFRMFREAIISELQDKQLRQFKLDISL